MEKSMFWYFIEIVNLHSLQTGYILHQWQYIQPDWDWQVIWTLMTFKSYPHVDVPDT